MGFGWIGLWGYLGLHGVRPDGRRELFGLSWGVSVWGYGLMRGFMGCGRSPAGIGVGGHKKSRIPARDDARLVSGWGDGV